MLRHEPSHQEFINAGKREASSGQPVGKMFNAVQVGPNSGCAILLTLQIADISIGALAQNTRGCWAFAGFIRGPLPFASMSATVMLESPFGKIMTIGGTLPWGNGAFTLAAYRQVSALDVDAFGTWAESHPNAR